MTDHFVCLLDSPLFPLWFQQDTDVTTPRPASAVASNLCTPCRWRDALPKHRGLSRWDAGYVWGLLGILRQGYEPTSLSPVATTLNGRFLVSTHTILPLSRSAPAPRILSWVIVHCVLASTSGVFSPEVGLNMLVGERKTAPEAKLCRKSVFLSSFRRQTVDFSGFFGGGGWFK